MKTKLELIADQVRVERPDARRLLDIGYAQEPNVHFGGIEVHGIDIMKVEKPEGYKKTHVIDLNTDSIPYNDGYFDVVTMGCTLAHVANPLKVLIEIHRVIAAGGVLILSTPNPNYYWENMLNIFYKHFAPRVTKAKCEEHFFEFSRYNMRTIASRTGFTVTKEVGCVFQLVKTGWRFHPLKIPGLAYEIIYVLTREDTGAQHYTTFESAQDGIVKVPTQYS